MEEEYFKQQDAVTRRISSSAGAFEMQLIKMDELTLQGRKNMNEECMNIPYFPIYMHFFAPFFA